MVTRGFIMNYPLLDIKKYDDCEYDCEIGEHTYYDVVLNENNIYGLPSTPEGLSSWSYLSYKKRDDTIKISCYEENKWCYFQINKIMVEKL